MSFTACRIFLHFSMNIFFNVFWKVKYSRTKVKSFCKKQCVNINCMLDRSEKQFSLREFTHSTCALKIQLSESSSQVILSFWVVNESTVQLMENVWVKKSTHHIFLTTYFILVLPLNSKLIKLFLQFHQKMWVKCVNFIAISTFVIQIHDYW
jgi:hypothetical protein